jgi:cysteine desulfurase
MRPDFNVRKGEVYLDNSSTTMMDGEIVHAMLPYFEEAYGTPETPHQMGREVQEAVEEALETIQEQLGVSEGVYWTSGGTEANNWAIKSVIGKGGKIVISQIEHSSVLGPSSWMSDKGLADLEVIPVGSDGMIDFDELKRVLEGGDVSLVSIQHANGEIGTIQDVEAIGALCQEFGVPYHMDACQSFGKFPFNVRDIGATMVSISAHKLHGPMGIGALYVSPDYEIEAFHHGGNHQDGMRGGSLPVPNILGFAKAVELCGNNWRNENKRQQRLIEFFETSVVEKYGAVVNSVATNRLHGVSSVTFPGVDADMMISLLDIHHDICIGGGKSECCGDEESHILKAIGLGKSDCRSSLSLGLSRYTTEEHVKVLTSVIGAILREESKRGLL